MAGGYFHSIRLLRSQCQGCVTCVKACPTEAIRVRNGKAELIEARCIDCGECLRRCGYHAIVAETDNWKKLNNLNIISLCLLLLYMRSFRLKQVRRLFGKGYIDWDLMKFLM